jgi:CBS domain containing-hemolysin-like protein
MDPDTPLSALPLVLALLAANAYFVVAEFAIVSLYRSRGEAQPRVGARALAATGPEEQLVIAQLGSSIATLGLGVLLAGQASALSAATSLTRGSAVLLALLAAALVHALFAAQLPKLLGIHLASTPFALRLLIPVRALAVVLRPIGWPIAKLAPALARLLGVASPGFHSAVPTPAEIRSLVVQGHEQGVVEEDEREMIHGVFEISQTVVREVMTPRIDVVGVRVDATIAQLLKVVVGEGHSRIPVYEGTIDTVVGVVLAKDIIPLLARGDRDDSTFDVRSVMREPYFVPDTKPVDDLLAELRQQKVHLAIVLDEFGGTYGLVTMEDLLEEIVGEIDDEYDVAEPDFSATPEGDVLIDGGALISEVNERYFLGLPEEDFDTIGGYIFGALGRVPEAGDVIGPLGASADVSLQVEETEDRRVTRVRLTRIATGVQATE